MGKNASTWVDGQKPGDDRVGHVDQYSSNSLVAYYSNDTFPVEGPMVYKKIVPGLREVKSDGKEEVR